MLASRLVAPNHLSVVFDGISNSFRVMRSPTFDLIGAPKAGPFEGLVGRHGSALHQNLQHALRVGKEIPRYLKVLSIFVRDL